MDLLEDFHQELQVKKRLQIGGVEGGEERQRESDGEERSEGAMSQLTGSGAQQ